MRSHGEPASKVQLSKSALCSRVVVHVHVCRVLMTHYGKAHKTFCALSSVQMQKPAAADAGKQLRSQRPIFRGRCRLCLLDQWAWAVTALGRQALPDLAGRQRFPLEHLALLQQHAAALHAGSRHYDALLEHRAVIPEAHRGELDDHILHSVARVVRNAADAHPVADLEEVELRREAEGADILPDLRSGRAVEPGDEGRAKQPLCAQRMLAREHHHPLEVVR